MFKLTIVGGPAKGKSYSLREFGETSIGRVDGNDVVLISQKVSKKHCVLVVSNKDVQVKDTGSSNGTFVNGILTKLKTIKAGDRVSVGEYVFELVKFDAPKTANNVIPMHGGGMPAFGGTGNTNITFDAPKRGVPNAAAPPQTLSEKVKFYFDQYVINFVYNLNEKHEWRTMMSGMFVILVVGAACLSVYPVMDRVTDKLTNEALGRALMLARQAVDRNAPYIFDRQDSKVDITYIEREPGVVATYIVDMEGRIMAPGRKLNQSIGDGDEGVFGQSSRTFFQANESAERRTRVFGDIVAAAVPLRIFSASAGKNLTVAVALVFFDRSTVLFDSGTEAMAYIQALILAAILGVIMFFSLYRLTLRPLINLNEQIDQVLKGSAHSVEKRYKMEEINSLIDVVNTALSRAAQAGAGSVETNGADEVLEMLKFTAGRMIGGGMIVFSGDKHILHWSAFMEEITGIRAEGTLGQDIGSVARDAAFGSFIEDLFARAPFPGSDPVGDDFEFAGTVYRMEILATGTPGSVKYYVVTAVKPS